MTGPGKVSSNQGGVGGKAPRQENSWDNLDPEADKDVGGNAGMWGEFPFGFRCCLEEVSSATIWALLVPFQVLSFPHHVFLVSYALHKLTLTNTSLF